MSSWVDSSTLEPGYQPDIEHWILRTGFWRDEGYWIDSPAVWRDYPPTLWTDRPDSENGWAAAPAPSNDGWIDSPPTGGGWTDAN